MITTRTKTAVPLGAALVLLAVAGAAYALGLPPFGQKATIKASAVCGTLGAPDSTAATLNRLLPAESSYSFDDAMTDLRTDASDDTYETSCFVNGGGRQLLSVTAEMAEYETPDSWIEEAVAQLVSRRDLVPFAAGDKAVAAGSVAAIYVPCSSQGPDRHLSVVVDLNDRGGATGEQRRRDLITLARNTAVFAHEKAKCEAPSKVSAD
ncbi:hypothetical protein [Streptomyces sp. LaPpAH-108]|uniref:hypothetical protein n=1 Tax=Streptomyces sp. LaPpAH-108 TaxID=1155714 RepID=UPI000362C906|nr:hypothetical protein [Streptomyces sp. LaPpAH-108]